jgi:hypothetical protein
MQATDHGTPPLSSHVALNITILDVNDNAPRFDTNTPRRVSVREHQPAGMIIANISATDRDVAENGHVVYALVLHTDLFYISSDGWGTVHLYCMYF